VFQLDYPERIRKQLGSGVAGWKKMLADVEANDEGNTKRIESITEIIKIYEQEFDHFNDPNIGTA
jgi:hypothetical protein